MERLMVFVRRDARRSREIFLAGWTEMVSQWLAAAPVPGLNRAIINCASASAMTGWPDDYDAVMEFWFNETNDAATMLNRWSGAANRRALADWIEWDASPAWVGEVKPKLDLPGAHVKLLVAGYLADGWSEAAAQQYWSDVHPVVAQGQAIFWSLLRRYVQIHGHPIKGVASYMPMAADIGAASFEDLDRAFSHEQYLTVIRDDEARFAKPQDMLAMASDREIILHIGGRG